MVKQAHLVALALAFLLLATLIVILHSGDSEDLRTHVLLDPEEVVRIEIQSTPAQTTPTDSSAQDEQAFVLQREGDKWFLAQSPSTKTAANGSDTWVANDHRVAPILKLLTLPQRQNYALAEIDQQELGLDPPRARVQINSLTFLFGDSTVDGNARYVLVDNVVYLYPEFVYPLIRAGKDAFINQ